MRERDINRKMFHTGHYNVIAKQIRTELEKYVNFDESWGDAVTARNSVIDLALNLAKRLQLDNDEFDPMIFLDRCSPDHERLPITELWDGVNQAEEVDD